MIKRILLSLVIVVTLFGNTTSRAQQADGNYSGPSSTMITRWGRNLNPDQVLPEYPRPQMMRGTWLNLNGYWELELPDNFGSGNGVSRLPAGLPKVAPILVPFPIESCLSGLATRASTMTYRKRFRIPVTWPKGDRILLHFGAVDWEAVVQVNGKHIGTHHGGYDTFSFDITDALLPDSDQILVVTVNDPTELGSQPRGNQSTVRARGQHTSITGIWQTVWLEPVPEVSIQRLQLMPDFDGKSVKLQVQATGEKLTEGHIIKAELFYKDEFVARGFGGTDGAIILRIPESQFKPWSPETPNLYHINIALLENNRIIDLVSSYTGVRKIEVVPTVSGRATILLNGKPYFQKGVTDHGMWPDGLYTAPSEEAMSSDITVAKTLGFNMIRKAAKVEPQQWYYRCDSIGMLVWQEIPAGNNNNASSTAQFGAELDAIVQQLENHPSVVSWVLFQQGQGEHNPHYYAEKIQQLDPSRLLCVSSGSDEQPLGNVYDVYMMPDLQPMITQTQMAQTIGRIGGIDLYDEKKSWSTEHWGYGEVNSTTALHAEIQRLTDAIVGYRDQFDVSVAVYHQLSDLEEETNGLVPYNRESLKVQADVIRQQLEKLEYRK